MTPQPGRGPDHAPLPVPGLRGIFIPDLERIAVDQT